MITGTPLEQQKYAEYVKQAEYSFSEPFWTLHCKSKALYRYYRIKRAGGNALSKREIDITNLAALTFSATAPFFNVWQVYSDNERLPNLINRLTISNETAYISDEALCDCFLSPKLSRRAYVASIQKAGLNRKQMAKALDAYDKHDRDKFLDVISELSPSALTQQYEVISNDPFNICEFIDEIDFKQPFRAIGHIYVDNESSPKSDDDKTAILAFCAFLAQKFSLLGDIDDDTFGEKIAQLICGYSIVFMELVCDMLTEDLGSLDPVVETLVGIVQRDIVRQCRGRYCNEELYDSFQELLGEFIATLPEHMQPELSATVNEDSAEEDIEEDEPQEQEGDKKGHMGFPKRTGIAGLMSRKSFLHDLFVELGSDFAEMKEDWFEYLFGLGGVNRPDDYPEQFIWIEPKKEFTILLNALYGDSYAHANNLIIYKKDQKKGETKWANNAGKYTLDKDDPFRQRIVDIIKKYNKDYKP
jgi:hypothetical protein